MTMTDEEIRDAARKYWGKLKSAGELNAEAETIRRELEAEGITLTTPDSMTKTTVTEVGSE